MKKTIVIIAIVSIWGLAAPQANAHLVKKSDAKRDTLRTVLHKQTTNLKHSKYVCSRGRHSTKRWHCNARSWIARERRETLRRITPAGYWANVQILFANKLAWSSSNDPWPNCPDPGPRDNQGAGHTWYDTVACENNGNWLDSPGYYRCGLQFDPMWERHYGRKFCP